MSTLQLLRLIRTIVNSIVASAPAATPRDIRLRCVAIAIKTLLAENNIDEN